MAHKYLKQFGMAALLLGCSVGLAQAAANATPPPDPSLGGQLRATPGAGPHSGGGIRGTANAVTAIVAGWNFELCDATYWYNPDSSDYFVVNLNTDGSYFYYDSSGPALASGQNQLKNGCDHGYYWVYVTNSSTGAWDEVYIYVP